MGVSSYKGLRFTKHDIVPVPQPRKDFFWMWLWMQDLGLATDRLKQIANAAAKEITASKELDSRTGSGKETKRESTPTTVITLKQSEIITELIAANLLGELYASQEPLSCSTSWFRFQDFASSITKQQNLVAPFVFVPMSLISVKFQQQNKTQATSTAWSWSMEWLHVQFLPTQREFDNPRELPRESPI